MLYYRGLYESRFRFNSSIQRLRPTTMCDILYDKTAFAVEYQFIPSTDKPISSKVVKPE